MTDSSNEIIKESCRVMGLDDTPAVYAAIRQEMQAAGYNDESGPSWRDCFVPCVTKGIRHVYPNASGVCLSFEFNQN